MKILHLNNTASVPLVIARHLRSIYDVVDVVHPIFTERDREHINGVNDVIIVKGDNLSLSEWIRENGGNYDLIHVHAILEYIPIIRQLFPNVKIIFTGHGTNVREMWHIVHKQMELVDYITVSTNDLLVGSPEGTEYVPNVADPTIWVRKNKPIKKLALYKYFNRIIFDELKIEYEAKRYAKDNDLVLQCQNGSVNHISNINYPRYLEKFGVFMDFKFTNPKIYKRSCTPLSLTAIQFLTLGNNKLIHCTGEYTELPEEHNYDRVMKRWEEIYQEVLKC